MYHHNEPGGSRRHKIVGTLIDTPKHGDTLPEEVREASTSQQSRRYVPTPQVSSTIGRDTLRQEQSPLTRKNEGSSRNGIPSDSFYGRPSFSNGVATRSTAGQGRIPTSFSSSSFTFSRPNTLRMNTSPTDTHTPQFRNGNRGKKISLSGTSLRGGEPVVISDSEEEVVEETITPQKGSSSKLTAKSHGREQEKGPRGGGSSDGEASRDEMQHEMTGRVVATEVETRSPLAKLPPLAPGRSFAIAKEYDGPASLTAETMEATPRIRHADRMRNKEGKTRLELGRNGQSRKKQQLGNAIRSSLPQSAKRSLASPPREKKEVSPTIPTPILERKRKRRLELKSVIFLEIGQIQAELAEPYLTWNDDADLQVVWLESGSTMSITISANDIAECGIGESVAFPHVSLKITDEGKIKAALAEQLGSDFLERCDQDKSKGTIILVAPRKVDEMFRRPVWDALRKTLEDNAIAIRMNVQNSEFFIPTYLEKLPPLVRSGKVTLPLDESISSGSDKSISAPISAQSSVTPLRVSQRQRGKGTESEEEEKAIKKSVEAVMKERSSSDPSRLRLRYPFDEAGGVTAFQSDIDKLDDREMLNDTIIEIGLKYLMKQIQERDPELHSQIYVFSSFFYKRISESKRDRKTAYQYVKKWTNKVDIFEKKYLVIPINERMHWYLAILTNPSYSVRRVEEERKRRLQEEEGDEEGTSAVAGDGMGADQGAEESQDNMSTIDAQGDTIMSTNGEEKEAEAGIEDAISTVSSDSVFQNPSAEQLAQGYSNAANDLRRIPVTDARRRRSEDMGTALSTTDDSSEDISFISATKSSPIVRTRQGRPGVGDGITRGSLVGGGGRLQPTLIRPGESFNDGDDDEVLESTGRGNSSTAAAARNKAKPDVEKALHRSPSPQLPSPPRSRSGATYTRAGGAGSYAAREDTTEKYKRWLHENSVVCLFDSLNGKHRAVTTALTNYLYLEYNDKKGGEIEAKDVKLEHIDVEFPSQGNFCDCGLYLLHAFERFFADPKLMLTEVIPSRGELHKHWQKEEAAKKREWWRNRLNDLADEWKANYQPKKRKRLAAKKEEEGVTREVGSGGDNDEEEEEESDEEEATQSDELEGQSAPDQISQPAADPTREANGNGDL